MYVPPSTGSTSRGTAHRALAVEGGAGAAVVVVVVVAFPWGGFAEVAVEDSGGAAAVEAAQQMLSGRVKHAVKQWQLWSAEAACRMTTYNN